MEDFLKKKYNIKNDLTFSQLFKKQDLSIDNHNDTKSFWNFLNDIAIYIFNINNYDHNDIIKSNLCHFCKPHGKPNIGGLNIAKKYNTESLKNILKIDNHDISNLDLIDTNFVESNHFIFLTYLISVLNNYNINNYNIIDIGGGYGNIRRLLLKLLNINTYTIIDIDSVLYYNKQFYNLSNNEDYNFIENEIIKKNDKAIYNISLDFKNTFIYNYFDTIDVVIATHSLSELDMEDFYWYLINIISKANIVLYATQVETTNHNPVSGEISLLKIELIKKYMDVIIDIGQPGQAKSCRLYIFKNKNYIN